MNLTVSRRRVIAGAPLFGAAVNRLNAADNLTAESSPNGSRIVSGVSNHCVYREVLRVGSPGLVEHHEVTVVAPRPCTVLSLLAIAGVQASGITSFKDDTWLNGRFFLNRVNGVEGWYVVIVGEDAERGNPGDFFHECDIVDKPVSQGQLVRLAITEPAKWPRR